MRSVSPVDFPTISTATSDPYLTLESGVVTGMIATIDTPRHTYNNTNPVLIESGAVVGSVGPIH